MKPWAGCIVSSSWANTATFLHVSLFSSLPSCPTSFSAFPSLIFFLPNFLPLSSASRFLFFLSFFFFFLHWIAHTRDNRAGRPQRRGLIFLLLWASPPHLSSSSCLRLSCYVSWYLVMNLSSLTQARSQWAESIPRKQLTGKHEMSRKTKDLQPCGNIEVSGQLLPSVSAWGQSHRTWHFSGSSERKRWDRKEREWMSRHRILIGIRACICERIKCFSVLGGLEVCVI